MRDSPHKELPYSKWPEMDRQNWQAAFKSGDFLDDAGAKAHLAATTRIVLRRVYGRFLGFLANENSDRLLQRPADRVDRDVIVKYVESRKRTCQDRTVANELGHLQLALGIVDAEIDWGWLRTTANRIAARAKPRHERHHLVTSEKLYALGISLMDSAAENSELAGFVSKTNAFGYRDGLMIALLAAIPLRRRTFAALQIGKQLVKAGDAWALDIGPEDTKSRRAIDFAISPALSERIDRYLAEFRDRIPGAGTHTGLWVSNKGRPMDAGAINVRVRNRTCNAFGFPVNFHRFRHAAATLWSIRDPKNVRGAKDLLGHVSFGMTEKHYNMSHSRIAGRVLAKLVDEAR